MRDGEEERKGNAENFFIDLCQNYSPPSFFSESIHFSPLKQAAHIFLSLLSHPTPSLPFHLPSLETQNYI